MFDDVLIIADIEGSSECRSYEGSSFLTGEWADACLGMTRDVAAVASALGDAGAKRITVKDFHRTGYNIMKEMLPPPTRLVSGYRRGPVPGLGDPGAARAVLFTGMHAASGTGGFLAHTLTSRIAGLEVNGRPMSEVELFASSLAPWGVRPLFFSGCPVACRQARAALPGIETWEIDKFPADGRFDGELWRKGLADAAARALRGPGADPFRPEGPFDCVVTLRDGPEYARALARRWDLSVSGERILLHSDDIHLLYKKLVCLCYLTPLLERLAPAALPLYGLIGRYGLHRVRARLRRRGLLT